MPHAHTPGQVVESKCIKECGCRAGSDREGYCDIDHCQLHAAAPEMLEALKCLHELVKASKIGTPDLYRHNRELITRATRRERGERS